jgi:large conductance mechanosensitive channel
MSLWREFKAFVAAGNVLGLAVAVVLGAAFGYLVSSFTNDILMQFIAAIGAKPNFEKLAFMVRGTPIRYGAFLNACVSFAIVALTMFFVVKAYSKLVRGEVKVPESERELLRQIRDTLRGQRPSSSAT